MKTSSFARPRARWRLAVAALALVSPALPLPAQLTPEEAARLVKPSQSPRNDNSAPRSAEPFSPQAALSPEEARERLRQRGAKFDLAEGTPRTVTTNYFVSAAIKGDAGTVWLYLDAGQDLNGQDVNGQTALFGAASGKQNELALALLRRGANPNLATKKDRTPLMEAADRGWLTERSGKVRTPGSLELIQALLATKADPNLDDEYGKTALMLAAARNDLPAVRLLLAAGADLAKRDGNGKNVFQQPVSPEVLELLFAEGRSIPKRHEWERRAWRIAWWEAVSLPVLIGALFLGGLFGRRLTKPAPRAQAAEKGDALPNLLPLKCEKCAGALPLQSETLECPSCGHTAPAPKDYTATMRLRAAAADKLRRAVEAWRRANFTTAAPFRWGWRLFGLAWLVVAMVGAFSNVGSHLFARTLGSSFLGLFAVLSGLAICCTCLFYASYLFSAWRDLPVTDVQPKLGAEETITCHTCAGAVRPGARDLGGVCGYCGTEVYRAALGPRARAAAGEQEYQARLSLHDAMSQVDERRQEFFSTLVTTSQVFAGLALAILLGTAVF